MKKEEAELLPGGLITCLLDSREVRILKISPDSVTVRVLNKLNNITKLKICFYDFKAYRYNELIISDYIISNNSKEEFYFSYTFKISNKEYENNLRKAFRDYSRYVTLKNYGYENEFSEEMVGYPAEKDYDFYNFYNEQKKEWFSNLNYNNFNKDNFNNLELAVEINNGELYEKYLLNDINTFKHMYLCENYINEHELFKRNISRIYIGNEFCHNLFPSLELLMKMMDKAFNEKINITICFTYMRECYIKKNEEIINSIYKWCVINDKKIEIIINDWGMLKLCRGKEDYFDFNLGILLNKRKKDPRFAYKKGYEENKKMLAENSLNNEEFRKFLNEYNIKRYEYESCTYKIKIPEGRHSMHMPFYITNVSQYCTLYAMCSNLDRGKQVLVNNCPKYCREYIFAYPKHLKMVGRYNSLFAFDDTLLRNELELQYYVKNGIDRIVLNFI